MARTRTHCADGSSIRLPLHVLDSCSLQRFNSECSHTDGHLTDLMRFCQISLHLSPHGRLYIWEQRLVDLFLSDLACVHASEAVMPCNKFLI